MKGGLARRPSAAASLIVAEPDMDLDAIIGERPPRALRMTSIAVGVLLAALVVAAALVKIDVVVEGTGALTMDTPPIVLQPLDRVIVRSINVKPGDVVAKGDVLATLDSTFIEADMSALSTQQTALRSHVRRLEAEAKGELFVADPASGQSDAIQAAIFTQRQEQYTSRLRAFDEEIQRMEVTGRGFEHDQEFLNQQLSIAQEVEKMRGDLAEKQYASKLQVLESQSMRLRAERDHREAANRQTETGHALEGKKAERQAFVEEWQRTILEELERQRTELAKLNEVMSKAMRMRQLVEVKAPEDAVVLEVASRSAGSVLREAEPLITLIPSNGAMIADVLISSRDIGYAKPGDEVRIKVDAFPYQRHGMLEGRLRSVSESSYSSLPPLAGGEGAQAAPNPGKGAVHRARIELTKSTLDSAPKSARLFPGMTVTAEIKVGTRSVLSYFFDPIRRGFEESLREPS